VEGSITGRIAFQPRGKHGFGYDPVFYLPQHNKTMAELPEGDQEPDQPPSCGGTQGHPSAATDAGPAVIVNCQLLIVNAFISSWNTIDH